MALKKFKLASDEIKDLCTDIGGCIATDHITVDGLKVGFMYRQKPDNAADSGWRFFSGTETQDYVDQADNLAVYDVNTIANYDPAIIAYMTSPVGTELERIHGTDTFEKI